MGIQIGVGFVVVLVLMLALSMIGLRYVSETNQRLKQITENNNVKIELATEMHTALLERALSIRALPLYPDPFDRDTEVQRFSEQGNLYLQARHRIEAMALSPAESDILVQIRELTRQSQPEVQALVEMAILDTDRAHLVDMIRHTAMPKQQRIIGQVSALLDLQRRQTAAAVHAAEVSYTNMRNLMVGLGLAALLSGATIAWFVSRQVARQARLLTDQALFDELTGLANRSLLLDRLGHEIARARRTQSTFGVALMDLDRFKEVNDTLGHEVGDELLREVAHRLKNTVRAEDMVARLGGDEYVLVLQDLDAAGIPAIAEGIRLVLDKPFHWKNQSIDIDASLGVALFQTDLEDPSELIRQADIAMYIAKRSSKGYALYTPDQEHSRNELSFKSELREAISSNQLSLYFQPQIDHQHACIVGLEALVRWNHPTRGFLGPDTFIPLAEEAGLIDTLTHWVLDQALTHLAALDRQGHRLSMSVNLSARNLHDLNLPAMVSTLLADTGIDPGKLKLEITESAIMANPKDGLSILSELDRMGVTLAIDDFGTGYSSLAYLKRLPVDELKIDKSFVMELEERENDAVIVRSTIDLAHNLGLKVTAEGVETQAIWDILSILGCDFSQGYLMGRAMPADKLAAWLQESGWSQPATSAQPEPAA
jgi:diguanylate cyclase (GGDEF)-like protein